jgi:hypothetical protein
MVKIKVIKEAQEVYYMTTLQGIVSVDGVELEYRYSEDSNGATLYIFDGTWNEYDPNNDAHIALLDACCMISPEEFGYPGEIIDLEDDFL